MYLLVEHGHKFAKVLINTTVVTTTLTTVSTLLLLLLLLSVLFLLISVTTTLTTSSTLLLLLHLPLAVLLFLISALRHSSALDSIFFLCRNEISEISFLHKGRTFENCSVNACLAKGLLLGKVGPGFPLEPLERLRRKRAMKNEI